MKKVFTGTLFAAVVLVFMPSAFAQYLPLGVDPPPGTSWVLTFDDEFWNDSSINEGLWNGGASNTDWCNLTFWGRPGGTYMFNEDPNNPCGDNFGSISFPGYLSMSTPQDSADAAMTTDTKFNQQYGFWEAEFEIPSNYSGEGNGMHSDFWMHPRPEGPSDPSQWCPEINVGENLWYDNNTISFSVWDCNGGGGGVQASGSSDLASNWHVYGMQWLNDGSPYGTIYQYLDGNLVNGPYTIDSGSTNMANGIYMFLNLDNNNNMSGGSSFNISHVRAWQAE